MKFDAECDKYAAMTHKGKKKSTLTEILRTGEVCVWW